MKNILKYCILAWTGLTSLSLCFAEIWDSTQNPYVDLPQAGQQAEKTDLSTEAQKTTLDTEQKWLAQRILEVYGLKWDDQWATNYVKFAVNLTLSLLFFVCVVLLIYGFYMILVSWKTEEAYKKAIKIVYAAGFGIVIVWLSFFIAQIMFGLYFKAKTETANTAGSTANPTWAAEWTTLKDWWTATAWNNWWGGGISGWGSGGGWSCNNPAFQACLWQWKTYNECKWLWLCITVN